MCSPSAGAASERGRRVGRERQRLGHGQHRGAGDVLAVQQVLPVRQRAGGEGRRELGREPRLGRRGRDAAPPGRAGRSELAQPLEEVRLERRQRERPPVRRRVAAVAGQAAGQQAAAGLRTPGGRGPRRAAPSRSPGPPRGAATRPDGRLRRSARAAAAPPGSR